MTQTETMRIRLPFDLKAEIAAKAETNLRSLNAEVVFMLREQMSRTAEPKTATKENL